mgnify:CR=1 FL=1
MVTQHFENGNIEIRVLTDYLSYFTGTAGIFNRIGMETLLLQHQGLLLHASLINYKGKAIAFAGQINEVEAMRSEQHFADLVRGLDTFGAKVIDEARIQVIKVPLKAA